MLLTLQPCLLESKKALRTAALSGKCRENKCDRKRQTHVTLPSHIRSSRCLFTLCLSVRDMVSNTARHRTARLGTVRQGTSPPQPLILTRFRLLVHCQHYSPGHTASAHTPARKAKIWLNITLMHTHTHSRYIHIY